MTDNEIIKALECCTNSIDCPINCPLYGYAGDCFLALHKPTLDLINRQKAEISVLRKLLDKAETEMNNQSENIKKLTADCYSMQSTLAKMSMGVEQAKVEAIKECLEWVLSLFPEDKNFTTISRFTVKQKLKEMVGDVE